MTPFMSTHSKENLLRKHKLKKLSNNINKKIISTTDLRPINLCVTNPKNSENLKSVQSTSNSIHDKNANKLIIYDYSAGLDSLMSKKLSKNFS